MTDSSSTTQKMVVVCPHCQGKVKVPIELLGRKVKCPHCRQAIQTTAPQTAPSEHAPPAAPLVKSADAPPSLPHVVTQPTAQVLPPVHEPVVDAEIVESAPAAAPVHAGGLPNINTKRGPASRSKSRVSSSRRKSSKAALAKVYGSLGSVLLVLAVVGVRFGIRQYAETQYEAECDAARIEAYGRYADIAPPDVVKSMVDDFHDDCAFAATHGLRTPRFAKDEYFRAMDQQFLQALEAGRDQLQEALDQLRPAPRTRSGR